MNTAKRLIIVLFMAVVAFSSPIIAIGHSSHYTLPPFYGWGDPDVTWWYDQDGSKDFHGMVDAAAYAWIQSSTPIYMTEVDNQDDSDLRVYSNNYGTTGWYGRFYQYFFYQNIALNEYYTVVTDPQWCEVASHEMGHTHGLGHYDCSQELMVAEGFIGTYYPQTGDVAGVNAKYP